MATGRRNTTERIYRQDRRRKSLVIRVSGGSGEPVAGRRHHVIANLVEAMDKNSQVRLRNGEHFDHAPRSGDHARHQPVVHHTIFVVMHHGIARRDDVLDRVVMVTAHGQCSRGYRLLARGRQDWGHWSWWALGWGVRGLAQVMAQ